MVCVDAVRHGVVWAVYKEFKPVAQPSSCITHVGIPTQASGNLPHLTMAFSVASWNIAAVNNNPFEYWVTHDSPSYNALMQGVQAFLDAPGDDDLPVSQVCS
jgi:hypothetical protein